MKDDLYDAVIVGAGTAGCAAAIGLPEGSRAVVVDRRSSPAGRCCGGLLTTDTMAAMARMAIELPPSVRVTPEPKAVHALDLDSGREQYYPRDYANIDRTLFDEWLLSLAAERAEIRKGCSFKALVVDGDVATVTLDREGVSESVRARVVIGADGALSAVRRAAFPARRGPEAMLAIQDTIAGSMASDAHEVLFSSRLTSFYGWAIPKGDCVLVGAAFSDHRGARDRFAGIVAEMRSRLGLEGEATDRSARLLSRPRTRGEICPGARGVLLAGEAAGLVSPSSGEGLSFAFESGFAAGRAVGHPDPAASYRETFGPLERKLARKLVKARVIFSPFWRKLALLSPWCP